jgi:hypothetical protein
VRLLPLMMISALLLAAPAAAEKGGKGKDDKGPPGAAQEHKAKGRTTPDERSESRAGDAALGIVISAAERALIQDYFGRGAIRAEPLPPGIAKNVARGKPLPPGIAKKMPDDLQARLVAPPGHVYRVVGSDVVLLNAATNVVVEILRGMLR